MTDFILAIFPVCPRQPSLRAPHTPDLRHAQVALCSLSHMQRLVPAEGIGIFPLVPGRVPERTLHAYIRMPMKRDNHRTSNQKRRPRTRPADGGSWPRDRICGQCWGRAACACVHGRWCLVAPAQRKTLSRTDEAPMLAIPTRMTITASVRKMCTRCDFPRRWPTAIPLKREQCPTGEVALSHNIFSRYEGL